MLIDSHAHIHFDEFKDEIPQVLERAQQAGVQALINVGTDLVSSRQAILLAEQHPFIFAAVGVHPHDVSKMQDRDLRELQKIGRHPKVVAVGEIGLDYHYEHSPRETQLRRLADLIQVAHEIEKPLILHCREAFEECFQILDETDGWKRGGVFHCYTGDLPTAEKIFKKKFYISFSGIITFKKSEALKAVAREISTDRFLIETDCPFLAPEPHRGKRNEPAYVKRVAEELGKIRVVSFESIAQKTTQNSQALFALPR